MKYKTYRQLTPEQKEEWQFRFKENVRLQPEVFISPFFLMINMFLLIILVCEDPLNGPLACVLL